MELIKTIKLTVSEHVHGSFTQFATLTQTWRGRASMCQHSVLSLH